MRSVSTPNPHPPLPQLWHPWNQTLCRTEWVFFCFCFWFWIHTASTPIASGTHTDGGAVIRKPGSAWLDALPQLVLLLCFVLWLLFWNRHSHTRIYIVCFFGVAPSSSRTAADPPTRASCGSFLFFVCLFFCCNKTRKTILLRLLLEGKESSCSFSCFFGFFCWEPFFGHSELTEKGSMRAEWGQDRKATSKVERIEGRAYWRINVLSSLPSVSRIAYRAAKPRIRGWR